MMTSLILFLFLLETEILGFKAPIIEIQLFVFYSASLLVCVSIARLTVIVVHNIVSLTLNFLKFSVCFILYHFQFTLIISVDFVLNIMQFSSVLIVL